MPGPNTTKRCDWIDFADELGRPVKLHRATVRHLRKTGQTDITITIHIQRAGRAQIRNGRWLTATQAARLHMNDVDGLTLDAARMAVRRGAEHNEFTSQGAGRERRIDPVTFDAWRLRRRELDLARDNEPPEP